jgi:hypothetical protein
MPRQRIDSIPHPSVLAFRVQPETRSFVRVSALSRVASKQIQPGRRAMRQRSLRLSWFELFNRSSVNPVNLLPWCCRHNPGFGGDRRRALNQMFSGVLRTASAGGRKCGDHRMDSFGPGPPPCHRPGVACRSPAGAPEQRVRRILAVLHGPEVVTGAHRSVRLPSPLAASVPCEAVCNGHPAIPDP